ncbi:MAG TPA: SRPBCC family protein, partial [Terriglobia bacterium]|nr:SRPBCC family protein [Terriglobia bacterium]
MNTDQIRRSAIIRAPRKHVWRALSDADEFSEWFGVALEGEFASGANVVGTMTRGGRKHPFEITIGRIEPEHLLSWRWHPHATNSSMDYSEEPTTLVVFELDEVHGGTRLTVEESGFDALPEPRRQEAYKANEKGWEMQMRAI